jgi:hypothetical protein
VLYASAASRALRAGRGRRELHGGARQLAARRAPSGETRARRVRAAPRGRPSPHRPAAAPLCFLLGAFYFSNATDPAKAHLWLVYLEGGQWHVRRGIVCSPRFWPLADRPARTRTRTPPSATRSSATGRVYL